MQIIKYVFGGYSEKKFNTCTVFDLSAKMWTNLPELHMPIDNSTARIVNEDIIISGTEADKIYKSRWRVIYQY